MSHISQKEFEQLIGCSLNQCVNSIAFKYFDNHVPII